MAITQRTPARDEDNAQLLQGEIADAIREEIGMRDEFAHPIAAKIVSYLRRRLGTQQIYIPGPNKAERDAAIYREFNGKNGPELCVRYDVSRSRLYEILEEQREAARAGSPLSPLKTGQPAI